MTERRLNDISRIFDLMKEREATYGERHPSQRFLTLQKKMDMMLDSCVAGLEELYHTYYIQGKSIESLKSETERDIAMTHRTISAFMPYMMMYNMVSSSNQIDPSAQIPTDPPYTSS